MWDVEAERRRAAVGDVGGSRPLSARSPAVGCPLAADEVAVPAEEGLRAGQEGRLTHHELTGWGQPLLEGQR